MADRPVIYLVQGEARLIRGFLHLADRPRADALFLTYDEPLDGATFFPDSTWSDGRNKLLEMAKAQGPYEFYVFSDDDVEFERGGWTKFEDRVLRHRPAIGVPVVPKTSWTPLPGLRTQPFTVNDEQVMAIRRDVVEDNLIVPYQSQFDAVHWWAACEIQEILIQTFYPDSAIQFNDICVRNECHGRYDDPEEGRQSFKALIREWLATQFVDDFQDILVRPGRLRWRLYQRAALHRLRSVFRGPSESRHLPPDVVAQTLALGSKLRAQYDGRPPNVSQSH